MMKRLCLGGARSNVVFMTSLARACVCVCAKCHVRQSDRSFCDNMSFYLMSVCTLSIYCANATEHTHILVCTSPTVGGSNDDRRMLLAGATRCTLQ